jgi:hypothetical protein
MSCITALSDMSVAKDRFSNYLRGNPGLLDDLGPGKE